MRRCSHCGFPLVFARTTQWHSDGTITASMGIRLPFMFMAVDERESIFNSLSEKIGFPIEHIFIQAQKNVGKELFELVRTMYGNVDPRRIPNSRLLRPQWLAKLIVRALRNQLASSGIGRVSVESYRAGEHLHFRVANPSLIPAVVGNLMGIYELVEMMPRARADYSIERGDLIVRLTHDCTNPESENRLYLEEVRPRTGPLHYQLCPGCGVPSKIGRSLIWDLHRGIVVNLDSGEREGMVAVQSISATVRELATELGDEVLDILYEAQKAYTGERLRRRSWPEDPGEFWEAYLTDLALRGQGYPGRFERGHDRLSVEIANAYEQNLYAAKLAAGLEMLTGRGTRIEWSARERHLGRFVIRATSEASKTGKQFPTKSG